MTYQTGMRNVGRVTEGGISLSTIATFADTDGSHICAAYEVGVGENGDHPGLSNPRTRQCAVGSRGACAEWTEYDCSPELEQLVLSR
jgi:hypothetical protein